MRPTDLVKRQARAALRPVWSRLQPRVAALVDARLAERDIEGRVAGIEARQHQLEVRATDLQHTVYATPLTTDPARDASDFMTASNCQAADFSHPRYADLVGRIGQRAERHRKQWEWVYILHHLDRVGALRPGARGLGFGVGREPLPAYFASLGIDVTATDAPSGGDVWTSTGQYGRAVSDLFHPEIVDDRIVAERVTMRPCDMRDIDPDLTGYDFNWSSCCFEHLGSLDAGFDFVVDAVERTLKPGGWSVHTTEFNLSSPDATLTEGITVLYRTSDMERLVERLSERGHHAEPFVLAAPREHLDYHVDVPPYTHAPHMKLWLEGFVATSVGVVVQRGDA